uniref:4-hydroxy-2-oxovalerate aldolase 1 n=1 Tax=Lygus hesperus TaxID=30085 RepID=A0A0A9WII5_LYGHE
MEEKAMILRQYLASLRKEVEEEKYTLDKEREASTEELKGSAHLPTCPMSDLADIDPGCSIHGHLSAQWKSLTSLRGDSKSRGLHTLRQEEGDGLPNHEFQGAKGDDETEWLEFANDYSTVSVLTVPQVPDNSFAENLKRLPSPPPETFLTTSQSYITRLQEVDDMCKEEMSRVNAIAPNLDHLNQMASDWEVVAANSPDFYRVTDDKTSDDGALNEDSDSLMMEGGMPDHLKSQLDSIEEFISALVL